MLNPSYCNGCSERGVELGAARALNVKLDVKLTLARDKIAELEQELRLLKGYRRDDPRRNVTGAPLLNRRPDGVW